MTRYQHGIRADRTLVLTVVMLCMFIQPPSANSMEAGVCRSANCPCTKEQLKQGMVDTPQGCSKCNKAALEKAKADYQRLWAQYKEVSRSAEDSFRRGDVALQEGREELDKFWMGELYGKLPQPIRIYFNKGTEEDINKEAARTFKSFLKKVGDAGWTQAVKTAYWIELVTKMGFLIAKTDTKLKEFEQILNGALKEADRAYELLQKARMAKELMDRLEKDCQSTGTGGGTSKGESEDESQDTREEEAAKEFLKSLRKVEGGYIDMTDNFYEANKELDRAFEALQTREGASLEDGVKVFVRNGGSMFAQETVEHLSVEQAKYFGQILSRACDHLARAFEGLAGLTSDYTAIKARR